MPKSVNMYMNIKSNKRMFMKFSIELLNVFIITFVNSNYLTNLIILRTRVDFKTFLMLEST